MVRCASVTSIADCESLVPRPCHCPSVSADNGYALQQGSRSKLNIRCVGPLDAIPVRSEGLDIVRADGPNTCARFCGNPRQPRQAEHAGIRSTHHRPALSIPVQNLHELGSVAVVLNANLVRSRPRSPDVIGGQGAQRSDFDIARSDGWIGNSSPRVPVPMIEKLGVVLTTA